MTALDSDFALRRFDVAMPARDIPCLEFEEGRRAFRTHGRIERSPLVRRAYFKVHPELVCDTCKKSIHAYYRTKFDEWGIQDFGSKKMAHDVYAMAKEQIGHNMLISRS